LVNTPRALNDFLGRALVKKRFLGDAPDELTHTIRIAFGLHVGDLLFLLLPELSMLRRQLRKRNADMRLTNGSVRCGRPRKPLAFAGARRVLVNEAAKRPPLPECTEGGL
jgi:hypothetical protein